MYNKFPRTIVVKGCLINDKSPNIKIPKVPSDFPIDKPAAQAAGADPPPLKLQEKAKSIPLVKWP